jgi:hypothetical protein
MIQKRSASEMRKVTSSWGLRAAVQRTDSKESAGSAQRGLGMFGVMDAVKDTRGIRDIPVA